jgi:2-amino-4-hydroxy-6-hydroxymethyldihydropteridine diphosphokinase
MFRCFLALGSNVGDRRAHLVSAVVELDRPNVRVVRTASIYSTEPRGIRDQPWFLNTVVEVFTDLEPRELLGTCQQIENFRSRTREVPNGPRTLDIDIVLFGERIITDDFITIPHPRYTTRRFVLEPLAEIAPDVIDPSCNQSVGEILDRVRDGASVRVYEPPLALPNLNAQS